MVFDFCHPPSLSHVSSIDRVEYAQYTHNELNNINRTKRHAPHRSNRIWDSWASLHVGYFQSIANQIMLFWDGQIVRKKNTSKENLIVFSGFAWKIFKCLINRKLCWIEQEKWSYLHYLMEKKNWNSDETKSEWKLK